MSNYSVYAGEAVHGTRRFRPKGKLRLYETAVVENPVKRAGGGGYSARLFVGLNVGQKKRYTERNVIDIVRRVRKEQKRVADATILGQKGIFEDRSGALVVEQSVQVIIIDFAGLPKKTFVENMKELAEELTRRLKQEVVILEIQRRGVTVDVYTVTP